MFDQDILGLSETVGRMLAARSDTVACAESCTGGLLAGAVTAVAGSSAWFHGGLVTYDNAIKTRALDVRQDTLRQHGAVSEAVAREMAQGALHAMSADWALSTTGIAGPGGAVHGKPVGTVCFGMARQLAPDVVRTVAVTQHFDGDRSEVRLASVRFALEWLLEQMQNEPAPATSSQEAED